jgi:5-methylcytosine-specific restriction endonuclease McrA
MKHNHIRTLCMKDVRRSTTVRHALTPGERREVFRKTGGKCHVCGGRAGKQWQADHVVPHRLAGKHALDNYLPVCRDCNTLRRSHAPKVQQLIMRLGTYARNEIRNQTVLGEQLLALLLRRWNTNRTRRMRLPAK